MGRLAAGETAIDFHGSQRRDEIGEMTRAVLVFRDNAIERMRLEDAAKAEEAKRQARATHIEGLVKAFDASIEAVLDTLGSSATEMEATARSLSGIAEGASGRANSAAAASEEATSNVQTVAAASEELTASIREIASRVAQANEVVGQATNDAQTANTRVTKLAESASRIGQVINLIRDIANQTNLLALNATIEAARAGDAGRGFAVVAAEVKTLASQTAKATEDIAQHIGEIQSDTSGAVEVIENIAITMTNVSHYTSAIAAAIEEQGSATNEIARNVQEAAHGTSEVSRNMSGVSAASSETTQSAGIVLTTAGELAQETVRLRDTVKAFLFEVRAA
jgi:methyl-accepting chemotaxis protein